MMKKTAFLLVAVMLLSIPAVGLAAETVPAGETVTAAESETTAEVVSTAEETDVPEAGITPDSWLYGLDNFMKELHLLITFDAAEKAGLLDEISGERLAEAREMVEADKVKYGLIAMKAYKAALEKTVEVLDDAILNGKDMDSVLSQLSSNQAEREKLAAIILEEVPEDLRAEVEKQLQEASDDIEVTVEVADYDADDTDAEDVESADTDAVNADDEISDDTSSNDVNDGTSTDVTNSDNTTAEDEAAYETTLPLKKSVTGMVLEETVSEAAAQMFAKGELNLRQIITVASLAEQTGKGFDEVLTVFLENGKGIGATAKALELQPKAALKGIKEVFKDAKKQIKEGFAEAEKGSKADETSDDADKEENTEQETADTDTQTPEIADTADEGSQPADGTVVENDGTVQSLTGKNSSTEKAFGSSKEDRNEDKSSEDNDDDEGKAGSHKDNKEMKEKTNQSDQSSERAKERSNHK
jgi:hypothetical protein